MEIQLAAVSAPEDGSVNDEVRDGALEINSLVGLWCPLVFVSGYQWSEEWKLSVTKVCVFFILVKGITRKTTFIDK